MKKISFIFLGILLPTITFAENGPQPLPHETLGDNQIYNMMKNRDNDEKFNTESFKQCLNSIDTLYKKSTLHTRFVITDQQFAIPSSDGSIKIYSKSGSTEVQGRNCKYPPSTQKNDLPEGMRKILAPLVADPKKANVDKEELKKTLSTCDQVSSDFHDVIKENAYSGRTEKSQTGSGKK